MAVSFCIDAACRLSTVTVTADPTTTMEITHNSNLVLRLIFFRSNSYPLADWPSTCSDGRLGDTGFGQAASEGVLARLVPVRGV
jgi:hypothetical protein